MTELTQDQFENSVSDKADLAAVKSYLLIGDDHTQLIVSAAMYAQAGNDDPEKITKDAEELRLGSIGAASRLRQALLLGMNRNTLQELATRVLDHDELFEYAHISGEQDSFVELEKNDPVRGPVFAMIRQRGLLPNPPDLITGEKMKAASAGTEVPRPDLPCELEAALRWAADAQVIPFKILNRAFFDWTTTITGDIDTDALKKQILEYKREIKKSEIDPVRAETLHKSIKSHKEMISRAKLVASYMFCFQPGKTKRSKKLDDFLRELMDSKLGRPHKVDSEAYLLHFATDFRPFWKKHAAAYMKHAKEISSKNKESAPGGPISTMRPVWADRSEAFVRFADGRKIPNIGSDDWNDFFNEFAKSQPEKRRTQKIIAAFMKTLLVRAPQSISDVEIIDIIKLLKAEGINAVDSETIRSCLEKLKMVTAPTSTKTDATPTDQSI
jgi:hypothetical protein